MTNKEIIQHVKDHPSGKVKIAIAYIDGVLRGKYISTEKFLYDVENGMGVCDVILVWDAGDTTYDNVQYTGWHTGYPDSPAVLDINTFRKIPWENDVPFFLGELNDQKLVHLEIYPRQILKKILCEANKKGYSTVFSQ